MSFFSNVETWFRKFFSNPATWEQSASSAIALTAPLLESIVALAANEADAVEVQKVVTEVQTDLGTVSQLLLQAKAGANVTATITNVISAVQANLAALLSAGHIKDAETLTKITAVVNTIAGELKAILAAIPQN